jgi:hypothetical protein
MLMSELAHHLAVEPWSLKLNITITYRIFFNVTVFTHVHIFFIIIFNIYVLVRDTSEHVKIILIFIIHDISF